MSKIDRPDAHFTLCHKIHVYCVHHQMFAKFSNGVKRKHYVSKMSFLRKHFLTSTFSLVMSRVLNFLLTNRPPAVDQKVVSGDLVIRKYYKIFSKQHMTQQMFKWMSTSVSFLGCSRLGYLKMNIIFLLHIHEMHIRWKN